MRLGSNKVIFTKNIFSQNILFIDKFLETFLPCKLGRYGL